MTIRELKEHLESYDPDDIIAYDLWSVDDVEGFHHGIVTREQAEEVIRLMNHNKDCNIGLNWDVLNYYVDQVMAEAE
jgi:hypothetical protein